MSQLDKALGGDVDGGKTALELAQIPYLKMLGMRLEERDGRRVGVMAFAEHLVGNPTIPALHGGTLGGLLESIAHFELMAQRDEKQKLPKTITLTIDYLRSGKPRDTFAVARVVKAGRRVATLHATAFQEDEAQPIATAVVVLKVG
ncbi:MAG: PaaI family thioesterase [Archangium sp.]|nr:PaaI family thioesterase [Archangium sp.]